MPVTNLAPEFQSFDEVISLGRMKQMTITRMTGDDIALVDVENNPLNILCIQDGTSYKKGHFYTITNDGVIQDTFLSHDHSSVDTGGTYYDILKGNYNQVIEMDYSLNMMKSFFNQVTSGTGSLVEDIIDNGANQKYVKLTSGTTLNAYASIEGGGGRIYFGKPITLQTKYQLTSNSDVTYRIGTGSEPIQNSITNSVIQLGFIGCSSTNANNAVYCTGGSNILTEEFMSAMIPAGGNALGLRLDYYPSSKIDARDGLGVQELITTNLPSLSAATTSNATFRAGIRTTTAGGAKAFKIYAARLVGHSYDSQSGVGGWV